MAIKFKAATRQSKSKFFNKKVNYRGIQFDSKLELECYIWLLSWGKEVIPHEKFDIIVKNNKVCTVIPDFQVKLTRYKSLFVDAKGILTPVASLKYKLFETTTGNHIHLYPKNQKKILKILSEHGLEKRGTLGMAVQNQEMISCNI